MPEPQYPTSEGLWSKGTRKEEGYNKVKFGTPFPKVVENFRRSIEGRDDFDPAVLLVWGTMQSTAVLNILKEAEETYGKAGQAMVRKAINKAGSDAMYNMLDNSVFPDDSDEMEQISYIMTAINTVLYASLEKPKDLSENRYDFDILWCPHQDRYTAFDCRVQRYFVEGMFMALEDRGYSRVTAWVDKLIPRRAECCHFTVELVKDETEEHPWSAYSDQLEERALDKMQEEKKGDSG